MGRLILAVAVALLASGAAAQECGGVYSVKRGDSLSLISDRLYKDARKWSAIYNANVGVIGNSPDWITVGLRLILPCIGGRPVGLAGRATPDQRRAATAPAASDIQLMAGSLRADTQTQPIAVPLPGDPVSARAIRLLTADDYAPFTDRTALNGGLVTEIVQAAMARSGAAGFDIHWVNDWSSHLNPLLSEGMLDMGFPWLKPDCARDATQDRCADFLFSDPMFEMLVLLFVDQAEPMRFREDSDIVGKTLCRPKGYYTHDLNKDGRNWLVGAMIRLEQPASVADCFEMLVEGRVDAVAINEFTGRRAIKDMGLEGQVGPVLNRPLSIEGLHVLVAKSHPDAAALLEIVNRGLDTIKASGEYQQIIDRHLTALWATL